MNFRRLALILAVSGCTTAALADLRVGVGIRIGPPAPVVVRVAPPPRRVEVVVASPGPSYLWVAGHYSWMNGQWVWIPGAWVLPPQPATTWVDGRWDGASRTWVEGHWEAAPAAAPVGPPPAMPPAVAPAPVDVIVTAPPPPPRREWRGWSPGRDYVWVTGYWRWDHGRYAWVSGHWMRPPHGHRAWVEPHWERRGSGYIFIEGTWR